MTEPFVKKETYLVSARKYRPNSFKEILAQDAIVQTLKNALESKNVGQAYLFSGPRGTGKTSFARLFAKSLNCAHLSSSFEPCNECASCKEITSGYSLDVLEMDGASNRGIEDIRQINDTVLYAPSSGKYKIYIIDEVHMLTKEAFNALLKTLEEPPSHVKFFFATTESHKIPATILSRCQKFFLKRIPIENIVQKLLFIAEKENISITQKALLLIAKHAEGAFRDAESLFDQIRSFEKNEITEDVVRSALGIPKDSLLFELNEAMIQHNLSFAFQLADSLYLNGLDLGYFIHLMELHFRALLRLKLKDASQAIYWTEEERKIAEKTLNYTSQDALLNILESCLQLEQKIKSSIDPWIIFEQALLKIIEAPHKKSLNEIASLLEALKNKEPLPQKKEVPPTPLSLPPVEPIKKDMSLFENVQKEAVKPSTLPPLPLPKEEKPSYGEDMGARPPKIQETVSKKTKNRIDTLLQFAAVEWDGSIERS